MIINKETKDIQSMSIYPYYNWLGEPWVLVPKDLEEAAIQYAPYCDLIFEPDENGDDVLLDIVDNGERPEPEEPEQEPGQLSNDEVDFVRGLIDGTGGII